MEIELWKKSENIAISRSSRDKNVVNYSRDEDRPDISCVVHVGLLLCHNNCYKAVNITTNWNKNTDKFWGNAEAEAEAAALVDCLLVFAARCDKRGRCRRVVSVRSSVLLSVTFVYCVKTITSSNFFDLRVAIPF